MQIPETPSTIEQLGLMRRLDDYTHGRASWLNDESTPGPGLRNACGNLYSGLVQLVDKVFAPLLDRVPSREMGIFTMHDRSHGLKVAHLMWHILKPDRQEHLTPPEIGMMVAAAYLHDLGMALSDDERAIRLDPDSNLWNMLEFQDDLRVEFEKLRVQCADQNVSEAQRTRARQRLVQAEEALLCHDTRERHATVERYNEIVDKLARFHEEDHVKIADIDACLSFDGDSFCEKLIDICVSHNQQADTLIQYIAYFTHPRFPRDYPVGFCNVDLHLIAAALRLADILDFDRERTPPALFHYLFPGKLGNLENGSVLEWSKHLTISNWHIESDAIVFRGRCKSHIIHHAVNQFCAIISNEIAATKATFGSSFWPFILIPVVKAEIHEEGYRYVPYKFELDDERVYKLLMGGAIYDNPLVAVRELIQNAVDACKLRDALTLIEEPYNQLSINNRIIVRYEEPTEQCQQPCLIVSDTGTGMDAFIIEQWFLKVGRSYYQSSDFAQVRMDLRRKQLDFAPISEFGIGFLSSFLLADRVEVETAMWEPQRGDTRKRILQIDGPTRLMRLDEQLNEGRNRFKGTRIKLFLSSQARPLAKQETNYKSWQEIKAYIEDVCQDLPYLLNLEYAVNGQVLHDRIDPRSLAADVPLHLKDFALHIPINDQEAGIEGEIVLYNPYLGRKAEQEFLDKVPISVVEKQQASSMHPYLDNPDSVLLRGGFKISTVPGLPHSSSLSPTANAKLRLTWESNAKRRFHLTNLARNTITQENGLHENILRLWMTYLLDHVEDIPKGQLKDLGLGLFRFNTLEQCVWLEQYDALTVYQLAKLGWRDTLFLGVETEISDWEEGKKESILFRTTSDGFFVNLLNLILPRVAPLQIGGQINYYLGKPTANWLSVLEGWTDYIRFPISWDIFVEYLSERKDLLYQPYTKHLNRKFRNQLNIYNQDELVSIMEILDKISRVGSAISREEKQAKLNAKELKLLKTLVEIGDDLYIEYPYRYSTNKNVISIKHLKKFIDFS